MKRGKKKPDPGATMGASNQFSAAQLIQMEMASELLDKKKQVERLTEQVAEEQARQAELGREMEEMQVQLTRFRVMQGALIRLDPSFGGSNLQPQRPEDGAPAPFDRLAPSVLVNLCCLLSAEDITRLGMVCKFLFHATRNDRIWVTFYANEVMRTAPHLKDCGRKERRRLLALTFREQYWLIHPKKSNAMKKADQAVQLAMKRTDEAASKAMEQIKEENLIAKVKEKKEMLDKGQALAEKAKDTVVTTQAFTEAKKLVGDHKGKAVDATDAVMVGQTMLTQLMAKGRTVQNSEKTELKSQAESILSDMQGIVGESAFLSTGLSKAQAIMSKTNSGATDEIRKLKKHGMDLAKNLTSPMEIKMALEQNPEFVQVRRSTPPLRVHR